MGVSIKDVVGVNFAVEPDPEKEAKLIINHIEEKRKVLGLKQPHLLIFMEHFTQKRFIEK